MKIRLENVAVDRGARSVLRDVNLTIGSGETIAIMGANGAGKSTLAQLIAGLLEPTSGSRTSDHPDSVRMVLQRPESSFLTEKVLDEVAFELRWHGANDISAQREAATVLAEQGLEPQDFGERDPLALSGGEQRRVAIAAVLAAKPKLVLLDEPTAGLDARARQELYTAMQRIASPDRSLVFITHDPEEALRLATRLIIISGGEVAADNSPQAILNDHELVKRCGLKTLPELELLRSVCIALQMETPSVSSAQQALEVVASLLQKSSMTHKSKALHPAALPSAAPQDAASDDLSLRDGGAEVTGAPSVHDPRIGLPTKIDARLRLVAAALAVTAAFTAKSLLSTGVIALLLLAFVLARPIDATRKRIIFRPLILLGVMMLAMQYFIGGDLPVELRAGVVVKAPLLAALKRVSQIAIVMFATLLLTAETPAPALAHALGWFLQPLRVVRVPTEQIATITASALGFIPVISDELMRLQLAQRARGITAKSGIIGRLKLQALLIIPLLVASFRRAHLLADALAARGTRDDIAPKPWRPSVTPRSDLLLIGTALIFIIVAAKL